MKFKKGQKVFMLINGWPHDYIVLSGCAVKKNDEWAFQYQIAASKKGISVDVFEDKLFKTRDDAIGSKRGVQNG